jgi:hypothetical protein
MTAIRPATRSVTRGYSSSDNDLGFALWFGGFSRFLWTMSTAG